MKRYLRLTPRRIVLGLLVGGATVWAIGVAASGRSPFADPLVRERPAPGARVLRHK